MAVSFKKYEGKNKYFVNPYNFVPVNFEREPAREEAAAATGSHTGVLECEVITKTPVAIPDTANLHKSKVNSNHKEYDFMRTSAGQLMIPGSSLRGPLRSMYEALTDSCLVTADEKAGITFRTKEAFKAGLIQLGEDGEWHLYRARRYIFSVTGTDYKPFNNESQILKIAEDKLKAYTYGQRVYIAPINDGKDEKVYQKGRFDVGTFILDLSTEKKSGMKEGYICIGEPFSRKHFESVFVKTDEIKLNGGNDVLKHAVRMLDEIIKLYNDDTVNVNAKGGKRFYQGRSYKNAKPGEFLPVWYQIKESEMQDQPDRVYLSVADIGRAAYNKLMGDMEGAHKPCKDRKNLCPACRLFGMSGEISSVASRVRFTDAITAEAVDKTERVPLKELAGPKTSYMPFYLHNRSSGKETWSYDSPAVSLRGRKFYWHNTENDVYRETLEKNKMGDRNQSMELVGADGEQRFLFSIYYEALTDRELSELIWTLTLGENEENSKYCHKIGHGKPIGLGSVKIVVRRQTERQYDKSGYHVEIKEQQSIDSGGTETFDKDALEAVRKIVKLDAATFPVSYPGVVNANGVCFGNDGKNAHASHQWFGNNFQLGKEPGQVLPEIKDITSEERALIWITEEPVPDDTCGMKSRSSGGEMTVTLDNVQVDRKDSSKKIAFYNSKAGKGMVFELPSSAKTGMRAVVRITKPDKGYARFIRFE